MGSEKSESESGNPKGSAAVNSIPQHRRWDYCWANPAPAFALAAVEQHLTLLLAHTERQHREERDPEQSPVHLGDTASLPEVHQETRERRERADRGRRIIQ